VSAVTPHLCIEELVTKSALPMVNLLQVVRESILGKRIALFGTRFVIETDLFGTLQGQNTVRPRAEGSGSKSTEAYVRTALRGEGAKEERKTLAFLAHTMIQREGLEAIVFAGTDLALLFNPSNTTFPFIDCAQLHIDAIVKRVLP